MIINAIIAAFVAIFFWGKATKDVEEKTQLASKMRTFVYGALAFVVLVFYIKTNQVAVLTHTIQLNGLRETVDSTGHVIDSIAKIDIVNKFSSGITENSSMDTSNEELKRISNSGGTYIVLNIESGDKNKIRTNPKLEKKFREFYKYTPEVNLADRPIEFFSHVYESYYFTNSIPSFIPLFSDVLFEKEDKVDNFTPYSYLKISDFNSFGPGVDYATSIKDVKGDKHTSHENELKDYTYVTYHLLTDTLTQTDGYSYMFCYTNNFVNRLNFFTAADISQYTCDVAISTDCYVKKLIIDYDLPIEINPHDSCMEVNSYGISVKGDLLNKDIVNDGNYRFHVKLPTLANLQLIRSLILTTLLTALVSMFFLNFFYLLRKKALKFKEDHITEISEVKVKSFKTKVNVLVIAIFAIIIYISWRININEPFHIPIDLYDWIYANYGWIIISLIVVICLILYLMFRSAYTIKKKK